MLHESLYTYQIISSLPEEMTYQVRLNEKHPLYQGHFPEHPVTPGVVWGEMVTELLGLKIGRRLNLSELRQIKFLAMHDPRETPLVEIKIRWEEKPELWAHATGSDGEKVFFKMTARYSVIEP